MLRPGDCNAETSLSLLLRSAWPMEKVPYLDDCDFCRTTPETHYPFILNHNDRTQSWKGRWATSRDVTARAVQQCRADECSCAQQPGSSQRGSAGLDWPVISLTGRFWEDGDEGEGAFLIRRKGFGAARSLFVSTTVSALLRRGNWYPGPDLRHVAS